MYCIELGDIDNGSDIRISFHKVKDEVRGKMEDKHSRFPLTVYEEK